MTARLLGVWLLLPAAALAGPRLAATVVHLPEDADAAACRAALSEAVRAQKADPDEEELRAALSEACAGGRREVVLVLPARPGAEPLVTVALTGTFQRGNLNTWTAGGVVALKKTLGAHQLEGTLKGQGVLDLQGRTYQFADFAFSDDYWVARHWALFGLVNAGRDTKKALGLYAGEMAGLAWGLFEPGGPAQLKLSVGAGHRFESYVDVPGGKLGNNTGFAGNNAILSWRVKGRWSAPGGAVALSALVGFQHLLYAPPRDGSAARVMDLGDHRLLVDVGAKFHLASLGPGRELFAGLNATYDLFSHPLTASAWDLVALGSLGVGF